jgi:hypothetical protein
MTKDIKKSYALHIFFRTGNAVGCEYTEEELVKTPKKYAKQKAIKRLSQGAHSVLLIEYPSDMSLDELSKKINTTFESSNAPIKWCNVWRKGELMTRQDVYDLYGDIAILDIMKDLAVRYSHGTLIDINKSRDIIYDKNMNQIYPPHTR